LLRRNAEELAVLQLPCTLAIALPCIGLAACSGRIATDHGEASSAAGAQPSSVQQQASGASGASDHGETSSAAGTPQSWGQQPASGARDASLAADAASGRESGGGPDYDAWPPTRYEAGLRDGPPEFSCSDMVADGPAVEEFSLPGPEPDLGLGGSIVDGVYDLTEFIDYNVFPPPAVGPDGGPTSFADDSMRETIRISGGGTRLEYQAANDLFLGISTDPSYDGHGLVLTLAPRGATLNQVAECPHDRNFENFFIGPYYTATPSQFVSIEAGARKVFQRRP
jgi:hypothetical protein